MHPVHSLQPLDAALLARAKEAAGQSIARRRAEEGLSQLAMSELLGVSQSTWSRIETGVVDPTLSQLLTIIHALDIRSIEELMGHFPSRALEQLSAPPNR